MRDWQGKRYWVVGAGDGLGRALANVMSRVGTELVVSAGDETGLADLVAELPGRASYVTLDLKDRTSIEDAAAEIGPLDGVVYVADVCWPMRATDWNGAQVEEMYDINFAGCARVMGAVVPRMVARGHGHIVMTGGLAGLRGLPGAIGYGASKAGVVSLAQTMQADLRDTGVEVQLVNPGFIRTDLTEGNAAVAPFLIEAEEAAREMFEHMSTPYFARSFPRGISWLVQGSRLLPDWAYRLWRR